MGFCVAKIFQSKTYYMYLIIREEILAELYEYELKILSLIVKNYIHQRFNDKNDATTHSVEHYINNESNKFIKSGTLTKLLNRLNVAKSLLAMPIDSTKAEVPIEDIQDY